MESVESMNTLSVQDLKCHGELQDKALKWLYNKGYVVASAVALPNGKRADVVGYNEDGHLIIIEVKGSKADFQQDEKWESYLDYCDEFYFLLNQEARPVYFQMGNKEIGLLSKIYSNRFQSLETLLTILYKTHRQIVYSFLVIS